MLTSSRKELKNPFSLQDPTIPLLLAPDTILKIGDKLVKFVAMRVGMMAILFFEPVISLVIHIDVAQ